MTGKVIESGATGFLILIIPIALILVVIFTAWPVLLALLLLSIVWRIWQSYQWKKWSAQINPFFNQLVKENQGCLTPLDLSLKANLSGSAAQRFLEKKADEYGAQRKTYKDKGTVYYFLTASALGSIFEDSEPLSELDEEVAISQPSKPLISQQKASETSAQEIAQLVEASSEIDTQASTNQNLQQAESSVEQPNEVQEETPVAQESQQSDLSEEEPSQTIAETATEEEPTEETPDQTSALIQAELATRLDVNPSTVSKRKTDDDFAEWSQSRDPEGIAWEYSPDTKMFIPLSSK